MQDELFARFRELQSERLLLREITEQDVEDVFEIYSNKEVMLYFADRFPFEQISQAETMIREYREALSDHRLRIPKFRCEPDRGNDRTAEHRLACFAGKTRISV